jgi:hypothetical protein
MDVKELSEKLELKILCEGDMTREIEGCYCGDLLSWVMSRAQEGDVWLTVMGNINSVGVAVLADIACIVLTENAALDDEALKRAQQNSVNIFQTDKNSYQMACAVSKLI